MSSKKIELVLEREDYTDTMDEATITFRFYNDKESTPIRTRQAVVPKDHTDQEIATHLLRELLGR